MIRRTITTMTEAGIELARLPVRVTGRFLPGQVRGLVELGVDQVHATVETAVGSLLAVDELREKGRVRRTAAEQRATALRLWTRAGDERRRADLALVEDREQAAQRRASAEEQAQKAEQKVEERRQAELREAERAARKREAGVKKASAGRRAKATTKADQRRLDVLDAESEALDVADDAATAADEAARLSKAASTAKRRRVG